MGFNSGPKGLTLALDGVGGKRHSSTALPREKAPALDSSGGWVGEWTDVEKIKYIVFTGVRNPNHPARSESLYRVRYPGRLIYWRRT